MILPEFGYGGAEKSFCTLSVELSKKFNITLVVFNLAIAPVYPIAGNILSLDIPASNNWLSKLYFFVKRVNRLKKIKWQIKPDVSISFLEGADYINILSKQKEKIILSVRGSKYNDENIKGLMGWLRLHFLMPLLYKRANAIITVNKGIKKEISRFMSADKITTIYNGYDFDQIKLKSLEKNSGISAEPTNKKVIVAIGRLSPEKGFQYLLKVFKKVNEKINSSQLIIIGDGAFGIELVELCKQLNLKYDAGNLGFKKMNDPSVIFLGYLKNPLPILKKASIFTLCSSAEGFPNALIEAMALKIPVISTDCPYGPAEILSDNLEKREKGKVLKTKYGILAPQFEEENSIEEWANCINNLLQNQKLLTKYSHSGYERTKEFTSQKLIYKWESIILD